MTAPDPMRIPHLCDRCDRRYTYRELCGDCREGAELALRQDREQDRRRDQHRAAS